jgi:hypothetical protein
LNAVSAAVSTIVCAVAARQIVRTTSVAVAALARFNHKISALGLPYRLALAIRIAQSRGTNRRSAAGRFAGFATLRFDQAVSALAGDHGFNLASRRTTVSSNLVPIIALLAAFYHTVTAERNTLTTHAGKRPASDNRAIRRHFAIFAGAYDAVAALNFRLAKGTATVTAVRVAVVTGLTQFKRVVSAYGRVLCRLATQPAAGTPV